MYYRTLFVSLLSTVAAFPVLAQHEGHENHQASSPKPDPAPAAKQKKATTPMSHSAHAPKSQASGKQSMPMDHHMDSGMAHEMMFAGIPETRRASGTSWQPDETEMHAFHKKLGEWNVMTHFNVFLSYDYQSGRRGDDQINSTNWLMLMASRPVGEKGELTFRTMLSLEPATTTTEGYPLLFQTGESYHGRPLIDRQHPHDFFMELAAMYRHQLAEKTSLSFYLAASGEPALGPTAFPHRASAADNPAAPLSHHWQDATHIAFGVATIGLTHDKWQFEASAFNGHEPDEDRWDFDPIDFNSYSGRISYNPTPNWSMQVSHGFIESPEELHPGEDIRRTTASISHSKALANGGHCDTSLIWGHNSIDGNGTNSILLESNARLNKLWTVFGRAEWVEKTGEELDLLDEERKFGITQLTLGGTRALTPGKPFSCALGASVSYSFAPNDLDSLYGDDPWGAWVFFRVRPAKMDHGAMPMASGK